MPLEVIKVDYGKQPSVWKALSGVIEQISSTYQRVQQNKFEKELMQTYYDAISDPANKIDIEASLSQLMNPPQEVINPSGLDQFSTDIAGKLQQKEILLGDLPPTKPQPTAVTKSQKEKPLIANDDFRVIFETISALPVAADIDFSAVADLIFANFDKSWGNTALTQGILSNIMTHKQGQLAEQDPRAKLEGDLNLARKYHDYLYPEEEMPSSLMELYLTDPEKAKEYKEFMAEPTKPELDYEELNKIAKERGLDITGFNFNPTTNSVSFTVGKPSKPDEPKPTISQNLEAADIIIRNTLDKDGNPTLKIGSVNPGTGNVNLTSVAPSGPTGTISTADVNYLDKFGDVTTFDEYNTLYKKAVLLDPRLKPLIPSSEKVFRDNYDMAVAAMENVIEGFEIREGMFNENFTNEQVYEASYRQAVLAAQEYQKATGKTIEVSYESLETYLKKDVMPRDLLNPASWGQQRSVYKAGAVTFAFVKEMLRQNKTLDDYSPEVLIKAGIDINLALQYYNQFQYKGKK